MDARFRLDAVYRIVGIGVVAVGAVTQGQVTVGMVGMHNGYAFTVKGIEYDHQPLSTVDAGKKVGLSLSDVDVASLEVLKGREIAFSDGPQGAVRQKPKGFFARFFSR